MSSRELISEMIKMSIFLMAWIRSEINSFSSLLFLTIVHCLSWMNSSIMTISMVREVWSDRYQIWGLMLWLLISMELEGRKNRSITKFALLVLSKY